MLENGKISAGGFLILVTVFTIGGAVLTLPAPLAAAAKQDAWISSILTILISLNFIFLYNQLAFLYPSKTYVEMNEIILGKWFGKFTALLFLFYVYHLSSYLLREIGAFFTSQILVETPLEIIMIMFIFTSLIGVRLGLEVICRTALIFWPWIVLLICTSFLFLMPEIKLENIQPILGEGIKPVIKGTYQNIALPYVHLVILLMITPYVAPKADMKKSLYKGTLVGGFILTALVMLSVLVLGPELTARQTSPAYTLGKKITIGNFLGRIEVIIAIIWIFTVYFKLTICYYVLSVGLAQVLRLKDYKILVFPLGFLIFAFAILSHPDIVNYRSFLAKVWTPYSSALCFFPLLLLLLIGKIRKRSASKAA